MNRPAFHRLHKDEVFNTHRTTAQGIVPMAPPNLSIYTSAVARSTGCRAYGQGYGAQKLSAAGKDDNSRVVLRLCETFRHEIALLV